MMLDDDVDDEARRLIERAGLIPDAVEEEIYVAVEVIEDSPGPLLPNGRPDTLRERRDYLRAVKSGRSEIGQASFLRAWWQRVGRKLAVGTGATIAVVAIVSIIIYIQSWKDDGGSPKVNEIATPKARERLVRSSSDSASTGWAWQNYSDDRFFGEAHVLLPDARRRGDMREHAALKAEYERRWRASGAPWSADD